MNERIKELAEQAKINFWCSEVDASSHYLGDKEESLKKFAELIIRECAEICYEHSANAGGTSTTFGYGYKECGDDIKREFGVKE